VVERTFAWLYKCRRLRTNFERLIESAVGLIYAAMLRLVVRRWRCPKNIHRQSLRVIVARTV
jgi:hypothetical protein